MFMMSSTEGAGDARLGFTVAEGRLTGIIVDLAVLTSCKAVLESLRAQQHFPKSRAGHMTSRREAI